MSNTHYGTRSATLSTWLASLPPGALDIMEQLSFQDGRARMAKLEEATFPSMPELETVDHECTARDGTLLSMRVWRLRDHGHGTPPVAYILHGGGWSYGGHKTDSALIRSLASELGYVVVTIEYRLAPEHPFPTPFYDACDGLQWVHENGNMIGGDPSRIVVVGSSAGSNLAASAVLQMIEDGRNLGLQALVLDLPQVCHYKHLPTNRYELKSMQEVTGTTLTESKMHLYSDAYHPKGDDDWRVSPLLAPESLLKQLPQTLLQVAGADPLRDEGIAFARLLERLQVPTTLHVYAGECHGFRAAPLKMVEPAAAAASDMEKFLRKTVP